MSVEADATHAPGLKSWVAGADAHGDFPIQNLPYGMFRPGTGPARAGVAIGDHILDLRATAAAGLLPPAAAAALAAGRLNALFALAAGERLGLRRRLSQLLSDRSHEDRLRPWLYEARASRMEMPVDVGDYTDFYAGIHHAMTVGRLYRPDNPLNVNYKHLPIGYHGRASSVRPSGTPVVRPRGQVRWDGAQAPAMKPCRQLDYELELGVWIGPGNLLGEPISIAEAADHIAGLSLLNDWSARDIQDWERLPLGPFLAKSFLTSVSPWVVTVEALAPFRVAAAPRPPGDPAPLPYLSDPHDAALGQFALRLEVRLSTPAMRSAGLPPHRLSVAHARDLYWTPAQLVAHQTSNGCDLRPGDLLGTGTISGPTVQGCGSLLERTQNGAVEIELPSSETRTFLQDGDEVSFSGVFEANGFRSIGFGSCKGEVAPVGEPRTVVRSQANLSANP